MQKDGRLHEGHRKRVRKKFLINGLDQFESHDILEFILFYAHARGDTNDLAHRLLQQFGSIAGVLDAPYEALLKEEGVGEVTAVFLKMIPQFCRIYYDEKANTGKDKKRKIYSFEEAKEVLSTKYIGRENEVVMLILLDSQNRMLYCDVVEKGSINSVPIYIRKIVSLALQYHAVSAIISHNHPSGNPLPSPGDLSVTKEIYHALKAVQVTLVDHIIFADGDYVSMATANIPAGLFESD